MTRQPQRLADLIPGVIDELIDLCRSRHPFDDRAVCTRQALHPGVHSTTGVAWHTTTDTETED